MSKSPAGKFIRLVFLILFILACNLPSSSAPSNTTAGTQFTEHLLVSITEPLDGEAYPVSGGLSVRGEAISDGAITRMELWVDGALYEEYRAPEDGLGLLVHQWTWSPKTLGTHVLLVRAYNKDEQSAVSNAVHIKGIADPGYIVITTAQEGDTILSIAERYNVSVEDILKTNPGLAGATSLSPGTEIRIEIGASTSSSAPSAKARFLMSLNEWSASRRHNGMAASAALTAPMLTVSGQGCTATLTIHDLADSEQGFNIYRLNPSAMGFSKLASLPAHPGDGVITYHDENLFGLYHYYVTAYDDTGEAASNLVGLNMTEAACAGEATTIDDLALLPASVEQYYLYVSINDGAWRRFPADEFTYLNQSQGIDFNQVASRLAPNPAGHFSMRGEVWGMVGGNAILLGTFDKSFNLNQAPPSLDLFPIQNVLFTILEVRGSPILDTHKYNWLKEKGLGYGKEIFRFGTDVNATYGIWQVASAPFQSGDLFNPLCMLLTGKTNGSGTPAAPFEFEIDFAPLKPKIEMVELSPFASSVEQTPVFSPPFSLEKAQTSAQQTVMQPTWGAGAFGLGSPTVFNFDPCAQNMSPEGAITYYVRIIPMANGQAVGQPSNTVKMTYDPNGGLQITLPAPPPIPKGTYYDVEVVKFTGVHAPDYRYVYCVEIVENHNLLAASYKPGDKLCPKSFKGGNNYNLLEAIKDMVNFLSSLYNKLSDWVVELVDKLNPLCIAAKLGASAIHAGEKEVKDACHYIAVLAVSAAKTYAGLPPSLPNFDQLVDMGKGHLVDLAAQELEANGVPCPEKCKDVIRKGIDYTIEQLENSMSNSSCVGEEEAHEHGYEPLCLPPGVITKPDPRGQMAPAVVEVKVTRRPGATGPDFPEPTSCGATIDVHAVNDSHIGQIYHMEPDYTWEGAHIEGDLLRGYDAFPSLQPGESTTFPIILKPQSYWVPDHYHAAKTMALKQGLPTHFNDWGLLYEGAMATIKAGGYCKFEFPEGPRFSDSAVKGNSIQVGPLGEAWNEPCAPYNNCP